MAEGRIEDLDSRVTFEIDIGAETSAPSDTAQYSWKNGEEVPFVLQFVDNTAIFAVDGEPVVYKNIQGKYTDRSYVLYRLSFFCKVQNFVYQ